MIIIPSQGVETGELHKGFLGHWGDLGWPEIEVESIASQSGYEGRENVNHAGPLNVRSPQSWVG